MLQLAVAYTSYLALYMLQSAFCLRYFAHNDNSVGVLHGWMRLCFVFTGVLPEVL